jgi:lysozyme family protein
MDPKPPFLKSNIIGFTFLLRTWPLWLAMLFFNWLSLTQHHFAALGSWEIDEMRGGIWVPHTPFEAFGAIIYVPPMAFLLWLISRFSVHIVYRETIDQDTHSEVYKGDWRACTSFQRVAIANFVQIGILIAFCILCSGLARGIEPVDQVARWKAAQTDPHATIALDVKVKLYERNRSRYEVIQNMRPNGVPAPILFCLHSRESDNDFRAHAHEGSPLTHRTRDEPKGRLPAPEPPYTFEQSAEDAYYVCEHPALDKIRWGEMQAALDKMESFNGFGYRARGINAPYLWASTSIYHGGKYVRDGVFSSTAMDRQLGCAAILKRMQMRGIRVAFAGAANPAFRASAGLRD